MTTRRPCTRRVRAGLVLVALAVVASACTSLPTSGPVVDTGAQSRVDEDEAGQFNPEPPTSGMSPSQVVTGFLNAMTASPFSTEVAKLYLSSTAADNWQPEGGTVVYRRKDVVQAETLRVAIQLDDAQEYGATGVWAGQLRGEDRRLSFAITYEDDEPRIADPPNRLIVPEDWATARYELAFLYFFDPSGRILVPQPVYVPQGKQLGINLVRGLVAGPVPGLRGVVRSYLPDGVTAPLSVTVSPEGVADVDIGGAPSDNPGRSTPATVQLLAQLGETLRQDESIRFLRVTLGGKALRGPDEDALYPVDEATELGPNGRRPSPDLYVAARGVLNVRDANDLEPVPGVFGSGDVAVRTATTNVSGTLAATLGPGERTLRVGSISTPTENGSVPRPGVSLTGARLLRPVWDYLDRVWVVDRSAAGAVVHVVSDGPGRGPDYRQRAVDVPGITGADVRRILVSRDGTRVLALVRGPRSDTVRVGRVLVGERGEPQVDTTSALSLPAGAPPRITDIAWSSPTTITVLSPLQNDTSEVREVAVDGAPSAGEPRPVRGPFLGLAGSPMPDQTTFLTTTTGIEDAAGGSPIGFADTEPGEVTSISYAGG